MRPSPLRSAALALALALAAPGGAQLGIDLSGKDAPTKKADSSKKPEPRKAPSPRPPDVRQLPPAGPSPVAMPELDIGAAKAKKGEAARRLAEANKLLAGGDLETACLAFDAIVRDGSIPEAHDEARFQLAKGLARLGLNHAALSRLEEILARGPQGSRFYPDALEWLFHVGRKTVNEAVIVGSVARYASSAIPAASQAKFSYLLARYSYERGRALDEAGQAADARRAYDEARRLGAQVRQDAPGARSDPELDDGDYFAKARFLDGLVRYAQGDANGALESFKEVVRLTNPRRTHTPDPRLRELAFLQLARLHYEHKQNRYAIFYYDKMPWGGDSWLEGLWESSYAHYRIGDYEKALGNLLTLQSPYFKDEWFPESWILKAIIYYENCRYAEARAILDDFRKLYEPVYAELDRQTARQGPPSTFYDLIEATQKGKSDARPMTRRLMKIAFTDESIKRLDDSIMEVEREMDAGLGARREAFRSSALAKDLRERLAGERKRLVDEAGARARGKLEYERDGLRDLLQSALRIKIEVARKEREVLEGSLVKGGRLDVVRDYRYSVAVGDEELYWPYDGEFWRDELGTYTYTLTKGCRDVGARATASAR